MFSIVKADLPAQPFRQTGAYLTCQQERNEF